MTVLTSANVGNSIPATLGKKKEPWFVPEGETINRLARQIIADLFEGGPGSGRRPGDGGRKISIDRAQELIGRMRMKIDLSAGSVKYDPISKMTSYIVINKLGNRTRMSAKDIINLVQPKKKLKESFD